MQKFRQSSIVFEKPGISSENLKTMTSSNYPTVQYFFCVWDFFKFYLDLELFAKIKKDLVSSYLFFTFLLITQDLNKIKKIPHTLL